MCQGSDVLVLFSGSGPQFSDVVPHPKARELPILVVDGPHHELGVVGLNPLRTSLRACMSYVRSYGSPQSSGNAGTVTLGDICIENWNSRI